MSSWMVYTLGDAGFFAGLFNAIAMIFGSSAFRGDASDFGGTLIYLAFLFALIAVLMNGLMSQWKSGNNPTMLLVLFIVWMVGGYTKATVVIEDIYSGSSRAVDNVPLMVAVPASIITTVAMDLGRLSQTAFQAADANATELTTDGFVNPLKLMLSVRQAASYSPHMTQNWGGFVRNCMIGASSPQQLLSSTDGVYGALTNAANLTAHRHTNYYAANAVSPTVMSCADAGPQIQSDFIAYFNETNPALNRAMRDATGRNSTSTDKTWTDLSNFYATNSTLAGLSAQRTSANIMMHQTTNDVFKCGNNSSDPTAYFQCTQVLSGQQQAFTVDSAASGAGFTRTVITSMGFLLAIFIGLAPLVIIVALMSGANALPLLGKYILFGAWTQSWLPAAYMVNYFIVYTWTESMANLKKMFLPVPAPANAALPIEAVPLFFSETMDKIAVASDLLAAVPLITLAAMTGSYFALAKLGERWSGKDYSDEKMAAPSLSNVGAVSSNAAVRDYSLGAGGQMTGAARVKYNLQDGLSQSVADKEQEALRVGSEVTQDWSKGGRFSSGWDRAVQTARSDVSQVGQTWAQGVSFADKMVQNDSFGNKVSDAVRSELGAQVKASMSAAMMGNGISGVLAGNYSGVSQEAKEWLTSTSEGKEWANQIRNEYSKQQYSSLQGTDSLTKKAGFSEDEAAGVRESVSRQASTVSAYEEATQVASGIAGTYSGNAGELNRNLMAAGMYETVMGMHASLYNGTGEASDRYREAYNKIESHEKGLGVQAFDAQLGWVMGAMLSSGQYDNVMSVGQQITGSQGLDTPELGSNKGVGSPVTTLEGKTVEELKARHGAAPAGPAAPQVNPNFAREAAGERDAPIDPIPSRPSNSSPANPGGVRTFSSDDGKRVMRGADVNATQGVFGAGAYVVDETINTAGKAVDAAGDAVNFVARQYNENIGAPFANAVNDFFGIGTNTKVNTDTSTSGGGR